MAQKSRALVGYWPPFHVWSNLDRTILAAPQLKFSADLSPAKRLLYFYIRPTFLSWGRRSLSAFRRKKRKRFLREETCLQALRVAVSWRSERRGGRIILMFVKSSLPLCLNLSFFWIFIVIFGCFRVLWLSQRRFQMGRWIWWCGSALSLVSLG